MRRATYVLMLCAATACSSATSSPQPIRHPGAKALTLAKNSPAWVVDQFYAWTDFPGFHDHTTGEFARRFARIKPLGATLKPAVVVSAPREVSLTPSRAVYAITLTTKDRAAEWYTFLTREDTTWKIDAVRTLEFKPVFYTLLDTLQTGWRFRDAPPTLRKSMALTIATDSVQRKYFLDHQDALTAIVTSFRNHPALKSVDIGDPAALNARRGHPSKTDRAAPVRPLLERVTVSSVFRDDKFQNCSFIRIGGMGKAHAGYLYAPQGCQVPQLSPQSFIYVAKLADTWYAYRVL